MRFAESSGYIYILLFVICFSMRFAVIHNYSAAFGGDEVAYDKLARVIVTEHKYFTDDEYSHPPVYPFLVSLLYRVWDFNAQAVRIFQALIDSLMCVLMYWLCRKLFNGTTALIASIFAATYLVFVKSAALLFTETLFTFMLLALVCLLYMTKEKFSYLNAAVIGILAAILTLTKGIAMLFLPFLFLALLAVKYHSAYDIKEWSKRAVVIILFFLVSIAPWAYRNYRVYKAFVPVSTQSGWALYSAYFPVEGKKYGFNVIDDNVKYAMSLKSQTAMSDYLTKKALEFIKANPFKVLKLEALKAMYFWSPIDWGIIGGDSGTYNFQYVFMLPFAVFGMFLLLKDINRHIILYFPIVYIFLMCLVFQGGPRFRMPIEPYLIIFFAVGIRHFTEHFKSKLIPLAASVLYAVLNFVLFLNFDLAKQAALSGLRLIGLW